MLRLGQPQSHSQLIPSAGDKANHNAQSTERASKSLPPSAQQHIRWPHLLSPTFGDRSACVELI